MSRLVWPVSLVILANLTPPLALATEPLLPRAVLVLDATEPNSPWGNDFRAALRTALSTDPRKPVAIYSEILDLSRFSSTTYEEVLRTFLHAKYSDKPLGVIVVHGPQALEIVMRWRTELWSAGALGLRFCRRRDGGAFKSAA